jgi:hypothetical protein
MKNDAIKLLNIAVQTKRVKSNTLENVHNLLLPKIQTKGL